MPFRSRVRRCLPNFSLAFLLYLSFFLSVSRLLCQPTSSVPFLFLFLSPVWSKLTVRSRSLINSCKRPTRSFLLLRFRKLLSSVSTLRLKNVYVCAALLSPLSLSPVSLLSFFVKWSKQKRRRRRRRRRCRKFLPSHARLLDLCSKSKREKIERK